MTEEELLFAEFGRAVFALAVARRENAELKRALSELRQEDAKVTELKPDGLAR